MNKTPDSELFLSIVSPVYRAEKILPELLSRLVASLRPWARNFEIILVDDRSPDGSWRVMESLLPAYPELRALRLSRNFGQHHAISAGLQAARGEWVVVMDCDLQDQPEEIEKLYRQSQTQNCDMVLAYRKNRQDSFLKRASSFVFYKILSYLCEERISQGIANFGIYHRKVIAAVNSLPESTRYFPVFVQWVGFNKSVLDVTHAARPEGKSSYNFKRSLHLALSIILASSDKPLRLFIKAGLSISGFSFLYGLWLFYRAFNHQITLQGWASLMISLWFWGGLLMAVLGVVGLYVGRSFNESKRRPLYIVSDEREKL